MSYGNRNSRYGGNRGGYGGGSRGGYGGSSFSSGPKPVEAGKEYDVEITELSRRGDGVAKISGFIIFVRNSTVGQKVKVKIESVGPRFATASVVGASSGESKSSGSSDADNRSGSSSVTEPV